MDVDDDEMLRLALEASAKEHQSQHTELVIGTRFEKERRTVSRPDWPDQPGPASPAGTAGLAAQAVPVQLGPAKSLHFTSQEIGVGLGAR